MMKIGSAAVLLLLLSGCTNYHIEQNSKNGMTSTSCAEKSAKGNLTFKKDCEIHVDHIEK
ncbi:hypothetical protein WOB87_11935 [Vibrio parahaemolyticus]|uniref:hypothetical protein n=1 Tax=Vibrio parahaemolyticus TaxID=670 RepID=UPI0030F27F12